MIIHELRATNSRLEKERILKSATIQDLRMFRYAYDKDLSFGVRFDYTGPSLHEPTAEDFELLKKLAARQLSGHAAQAEVYTHCVDTDSELVKLICNRDLDCGVTATLVNKVWPGAIPQFKVQLAKAQPLSKLKFPLYAEMKYDGVRLVITKSEDEVLFRTRNGKRVNLPITAALITSCSISRFMLDCEVTLAGGFMEDRTKVSGMINSAMHGGRVNEDLLQFNVFDAMTLVDFECAACDLSYSARRSFVEAFVGILDIPNLEVAQRWYCETRKGVESVYANVIAQGNEGLILKHSESKYLFKQSVEWTKMKEVKSADLAVVDIQEGTGKYEGQIGALICRGTVDDHYIKVNVGTGLSDAERSLPNDYFLGQVVEVLYNTTIQDSITNEWSLFLPRFTCVRFDK